METKYTGRELALKVQERLSLFHSVSNDYTIGKNKIYFTMNGSTVYIMKHREKTTGNRKTIIECDNCFPVVLYPDDKEMYTELDIEKAVNGLDRYFIAEVLGKSQKLAFCNAYYYVKNGLKPFFQGVDDAEKAILEMMAYEADNSESSNSTLKDKESVVFIFLAESGEGEKVLAVDVERYKLKIFVFDYEDGIVRIPDQDEPHVSHDFGYADTPDLEEKVSAVLEGFRNIRLCRAKMQPYVEPETEKAEDND